MIEFRTHPSIHEIESTVWDNLLPRERPPHLSWPFLEALELTGCVAAESGWAPCHISLREAGHVIALAPAYVKGNSEGEFVFDQSWANFAHERLRIAYYPKLVVAVPFTPATGPRLLTQVSDGAALCAAFNNGLNRLCEEFSLSGAHVLFPRGPEIAAYRANALLERNGIQYHWRNAGYQTFEDFLSRFSSKRRNQIRRERKALLSQGIEIAVVTGSDLTSEMVDHAYAFYLSTVHKYFWGRVYLNRAFFEEICARIPDQILLFLATRKGQSKPIAGAFNLLDAATMYGRYWGATEEVEYLHFNVCYYAGIEECIRRKLTVFEPGAGGEHKVARGFEPTLTHSFHQVQDPRFRAVLADFLGRERDAVREHIAQEGALLKPWTPASLES